MNKDIIGKNIKHLIKIIKWQSKWNGKQNVKTSK